MGLKPAQWPCDLRSRKWFAGTHKDAIYHRGGMKNQGLPDGRSLLIARHPGDRGLVGKQPRRGAAMIGGAILDFRQDRHRHIEKRADLGVPDPGFDVEQQPARGVGAIGGLRQSEILNLARDSGRVLVDDLARQCDVAVQTIRRDLTEMADLGLLERVHGGAVPRQGVVNIAYEARRRLNEAGKAAIAAACAAAIPDNSSLILNLGTTTEAVARALLNHKNLTVVTNTMNVADILVQNPGPRSWWPGAPCGARMVV